MQKLQRVIGIVSVATGCPTAIGQHMLNLLAESTLDLVGKHCVGKSRSWLNGGSNRWITGGLRGLGRCSGKRSHAQIGTEFGLL
jgi:hypothetical protein